MSWWDDILGFLLCLMCGTASVLFIVFIVAILQQM